MSELVISGKEQAPENNLFEFISSLSAIEQFHQNPQYIQSR